MSGIQQPQAEHPLAAQLRQAGITKATIIDDAFDPPTRDGHRMELAALWARVVGQEELLVELRGLKPEISDESEIDDDMLAKLWNERDTLPKIGPILKEEFAAKYEDVCTLKRLGDGLSALGVASVLVGSEQELPSEAPKLVFIDYYLGPGAVSDSVNVASSRAREIYRKAVVDGDKPFIVLMSSKPDADAAKDAFRNASGLLGGLFGYCPKEDLADRERLYLHLATWAIDMPTRHEIQHFVEALEAAADSAKTDFVQRVRALGFEDYANIQWLSLQSEGHPLGAYMLWLYKSLLAHLLHESPGVLAQQKKLDAMSFEQFTPSQAAPSPLLAEIYSYALTEPGVEEVGPHPRAPDGSQTSVLQLGDLFFKEQSHDVLMVINAACDLAYAPGAKREFPKDLAVLLLHGTLYPCESLVSGGVRTELFKYESKAFRIVWHESRVTSKEYGEVKEWLGQQGYARKARLTLPYALQVQQAFGMRLMRIGTPVRPPLFRHADVEVYCRGVDGTSQLVAEPIHDGALVIRRRMEDRDQDEELFVLTRDCVHSIVKKLDVVIERCNHERTHQEQINKAATGGTGRLDEKIAKLKQLKDLEWLKVLRTLVPLPRGKQKKEINSVLWVYGDRTFDGLYSEQPPIVLNIKSAMLSAEPPAAAVPAPEESTPTEGVVAAALPGAPGAVPSATRRSCGPSSGGDVP